MMLGKDEFPEGRGLQKVFNSDLIVIKADLLLRFQNFMQVYLA